MTIVFVYDHCYYLKGSKIYSSGAFSKQSWHRYLKHCDELIVVGQCEPLLEDEQKFNLVNHPKVQFVFIPKITPSNFFKKNLLNDSEFKRSIEKCDAVIIRMYSEWGFQAIYLARQLKKPYALEVVGCPLDAFLNHPSLLAKVFAPVAYLRLKKEVRRASFVLYVTKYFLQRRYPTNGHSVNASNVMLKKPNSEVLKDRLSKIESMLTGNHVHLGVIGKVDVRAKGIQVIVRALSLIKNSVSFKLSVVGPGDPTELKALVMKSGLDDQVSFLGKLTSGTKVNHFLDSIDIYVHPSKQEGLSRSIIEAMSRACPILSSSIAGSPELVSNEFLHSPGDYKMLSKQIVKIISNEEKLKETAIQNFENAKNYYPEVLEQQRAVFWSEFVRCTKSQS